MSRDQQRSTCMVRLLDDSSLVFDINKDVTGQEIVDKVCQTLQIVERGYFSCTHFRHDIEVWIKNEKRICGRIKGGALKTLMFKVKFYPTEPEKLSQQTRYQLFLQLSKQVACGQLPCSEVSLCLLGSYLLQSIFGDSDDAFRQHGPDFVNHFTYGPTYNPDRCKDIIRLHRNHRGMSSADAVKSYVELTKNMSLYGLHLHDAVDPNGESVLVGVSPRGITVMQGSVRLRHFNWYQILKITRWRNQFSIRVRFSSDADLDLLREASKLTFQLGRQFSSAADRLWRLAVEHHQFYRLLNEKLNTDERVVVFRHLKHRAVPGRICLSAIHSYEKLDPPGVDQSSIPVHAYTPLRLYANNNDARAVNAAAADAIRNSADAASATTRLHQYLSLVASGPYENVIDPMTTTAELTGAIPLLLTIPCSLTVRSQVASRGDFLLSEHDYVNAAPYKRSRMKRSCKMETVCR